MNVGQLISELNKFPHDLKIYSCDSRDDIYLEIDGFKEIRIRDNKVLYWCKNFKPFLKDADRVALEVLFGDEELESEFLCYEKDGEIIDENSNEN